MPSVASIFNMARTECNKTSAMSGLSDAELLPFLNTRVYNRVQEEIRKRVDGEFFTYTFTTNIVDNEEKYLLPQADSTTPGVLSLIEVSLLETSTSDYYTVIYERGTKGVANSEGYEAVNATNHYYDKRNGYLYLYPTPTENITDGLTVLATVTLQDLTVLSAEEDIFPNHQELRIFHNVLVEGMRAVIYSISGDTELKREANMEFDKAIQSMCRALQKGQEPIEGEPFNESHLY